MPDNAQVSIPLPQWLTLLSHLYPVEHLTVVGAGMGSSPLLHWASEQNVTRADLIEGDAGQVEKLGARWKTRHPDWQCHQMVIHPGYEGSTFYLASHAGESGLIHPESLQALWPNLHCRDEQPCELHSLAEWSAERWAEQSGAQRGRWLSIGFFCDAEILAQCQQAFAATDVLFLRVALQPALPEGLTAPAWRAALKEAGFRIVHRESEHHPGIERWLCVRDHQQLAQSLQGELDETRHKLEQTHTWFMNRKRQAEEGAEQLNALQAEHDALQAKYQEQAQRLGSKEAELKKVSEQLASQKQQSNATQQRIAQLERKLETLFSDQQRYIQQTTNALGQHVTRRTRHPEE
jgi:hypothetical protein